jgi:hypothetical protein
MVYDRSPRNETLIPERILEIAFELKHAGIDWEDPTSIPPSAAPLLAWILNDPNRITVLSQWQQQDDQLRQSLHQMPVPEFAYARSLSILKAAVDAPQRNTGSTTDLTDSSEEFSPAIAHDSDAELQLQPLEPVTKSKSQVDTAVNRSTRRSGTSRTVANEEPPRGGLPNQVDWLRLHQQYQDYQIRTPRTYFQYGLGVALALTLLVTVGLGVMNYWREKPAEDIASLVAESQLWLAEQTRNVVWENNWRMFATTFPLCDGLHGAPQRARQFQSRFGKVTVFDYSPDEVHPAFLFVIDSDNPFQLPEALPVNPNFKRDNESYGGFMAKKYVYLLSVQGDSQAYQQLLLMDINLAK